MIAIALAAALSIQCVDGVATVDQEVYEADANEVIVWTAPFAFSLSFDSQGNQHLPSHPKGEIHERKLAASALRKGRNTYDIESESCIGDPVIIVR